MRIGDEVFYKHRKLRFVDYKEANRHFPYIFVEVLLCQGEGTRARRFKLSKEAVLEALGLGQPTAVAPRPAPAPAPSPAPAFQFTAEELGAEAANRQCKRRREALERLSDAELARLQAAAQ
jgi:hypothetical protein